MYVWHLVDVLRIGTERLLTMTLDRGLGIPCWDENALAEARRYASLSPVVGLEVLRRATNEWLEITVQTPEDAAVDHSKFGLLRPIDIIHRNTHEIVHHAHDIAIG